MGLGQMVQYARGTKVDKIRILIAEDHVLVREGTRRILEQEPDLEVVGEAGDGEEAVQVATVLAPDVVIMDIAMPKCDGIEATRRIKALRPETTVLVLTAYDDDEFVVSLLQAGAAGYLMKSIRSSELVEAVRAVQRGESVLHPTIARKVLDRFVPSPGRPVPQEPFDLLSAREKQVLRIAAKGGSNRDIAQELNLSARTVQVHLRHIFKKLGVASRTEAIVRALTEGWVTRADVT